MTFRFERLILESWPSGYRWRVRLKGLAGHGFYASLVTDEAGKGLRIASPMAAEVQWIRDLDGVDFGPEVISEKELSLGYDESPIRVLSKIACALIDLGWGPWIGQHHQVIAEQREQINGQALERLRWDRILKFLPSTQRINEASPWP